MRIGWCCKWVPPASDTRQAAEMNLRDTTVAAMSRLTPAEATAKLVGLVRHNMAALARQIEEVAAAPPLERCLRIGSNVLPVFTHPVARPRYAEPALREAFEPALGRIGTRARTAGVRLSMHPGQYTVLATVSPIVLANTLAELEYHTDIMRMLGLAGGWHPEGAHINVHGGGRAAGIGAFTTNLRRLSAEARGLLTVENDEIAYGLDDLLPLAGHLPIVLDLHHHWCHSQGEHIRPDDPRIAVVRDSWRGVRPIGHISAPRPDLVPEMDPDTLPDWAALTAAGVPARAFRAHSELMWNRAINLWAACHLAWTDLEVEAKGKNLASHQLAKAVEGVPG